MLSNPPAAARVWSVGALCRAIADALEARFNPVTVAGEISGFTRASSGHCYFSIKDTSGQLRCAMFKRAAAGLDFVPRDGEQVEIVGRLAVYEPRGDLQLIVDSLRRAGQGALFEQFLKLKAQLESEGLFDTQRKRALPLMPRGIGVVTSLGAAALHDVMTTLQRRVTHIPVVIAPASVQGAAAVPELLAALQQLYAWAADPAGAPHPVDVIVLVRGGGSMEDLWSFNDERLARLLAQSPVPVVCGVGHETDFTIADFVADVRAPTPTAAAELVSLPTVQWLAQMDAAAGRMALAVQRHLERQSQRLDYAAARVAKPSAMLARQQLHLQGLAHRLQYAMRAGVQTRLVQCERWQQEWPRAVDLSLETARRQLADAQARLSLLDPNLVLQRGYAWLSTAEGRALSRVQDMAAGQPVQATLMDGVVDLTVERVRPN